MAMDKIASEVMNSENHSMTQRGPRGAKDDT
jgi:hypothetical protein